MNYMVFGNSFDTTDRLFDDIKKLKTVKYEYSPISNKIVRVLCYRAYKIFNITKFINFYKNYFVKQKNSDKCVYIYIGAFNVEFAYKIGYIDYIREQFKNSYHVAYFTDIHATRRLDISYLKNSFDDLYIFDKAEAKRLGINYYPLPYSKIKAQDNLNGEEVKAADLYFLGQNKGRYEELIEIYEYCVRQNITTNFYIIGVPDGQRKYVGDIHYINYVPYAQALAVMEKSNCGLELKVKDVESYSNRVCEAIINNKKLITNNLHVVQEKFYNTDKIRFFSNVQEIDPEFVKEKLYTNNETENIFSPILFLNEIEEKLINKNLE